MRVFVSLFLILLCAGPAPALTVAPVSFDDLVTRATVVVYGRVVDVHGQWSGDRRSLDSVVTLAPIEAYKGAPGERVTFKVPGGEAGGLVMAVPGSPVLRQGDLAVVFLASAGPAVPMPIGVSQGVYRVLPAGDGSLRVLAPRGADAGPAVARLAGLHGNAGLSALAAEVRTGGARAARRSAGGGR
jgi:hypothetical protein